MKNCALLVCGKPLSRKDGESNGDFKRRKTCNIHCGMIYKNQQQKMIRKPVPISNETDDQFLRRKP